MASTRHILFPFDFSEQSTLAVPFVRVFAEKYQARITLISVVPPIWAVPPLGMPVIAPVDTDEVKRQLQCRLEVALAKELAGIPVERMVESGDPAIRIVEFAHAHAADLIMMPTHGFGMFRNLLIGSVTAKVLHDARCPVWTATHAEEQVSRELPRTVVCAVDSTPAALAVMQRAADLSQKLDAVLKFLHVVPPISDWIALPSERSLQEDLRKDERARVELLQQSAGVDGPLRVAVGQIVETVTEEARQEEADLLVIGRGLLPATLGRLRTHAYGIIQRSPCPVLSV